MVFELSPALVCGSKPCSTIFARWERARRALDEELPYLAGVTFDSQGTIFGTTYDGGSDGNVGGGAVYQLSPSAEGWRGKVLAVFPSSANGYRNPSGGIALDPAGNLYRALRAAGRRGIRAQPKNRQAQGLPV